MNIVNISSTTSPLNIAEIRNEPTKRRKARWQYRVLWLTADMCIEDYDRETNHNRKQLKYKIVKLMKICS